MAVDVEIFEDGRYYFKETFAGTDSSTVHYIPEEITEITIYTLSSGGAIDVYVSYDHPSEVAADNAVWYDLGPVTGGEQIDNLKAVTAFKVDYGDGTVIISGF